MSSFPDPLPAPTHNGFRSGRLFRYGTAVVVVGVVLGLKLLLIRFVTQDAPFLLFFLAVIAAALIGGLGPGLLATALATLCNLLFFMRPFGQFAIADPGAGPRLLIFVFESVCISVICAKLQTARRRIEDNAREARQLERKILEISDAEQRRIGYDLHDGLGQHLTGIALLTSQLENRLTVENSPHAQKAAKLATLAEKAVEWTHDLTRSLSPPALEKNGLAEALHELAANAENVFSIECNFVQEGEFVFRDVAPAVHLYRIAQEAISNAVKHGHAKHVTVMLSSKNDQIVMQVADDGSGMQPKDEQQDGMGLRIMRYRATMIGAEIDVRQAGAGVGQIGTTITCRYRPHLTNLNSGNGQ